LVAAGANLKPWLARAIRLLDARVNRLASLILVNSPGLGRKLEEKGVAARRLEVITDWAEESLFFPVEPDARLAREHSLNGRFNVMYGGNLGPAQGLATVVAAAHLLRDLQDLQFVFIGDGEDRPRLEREVADRGLANVRFIPRQPMKEIRRFFAVADVLLVHLNPDPMFELQIPSKTMAYMACGKPILCGIAGSAAEVVRDAGAGLCCAPGDAASMAEAVRALHRLPPEDLARLGTSGRDTYLRKYTRSVQAKRFQALLAEVVAGKVEAG